MSLIWFIVKGCIFGMIYSGVIAVALMLLMLLASAVASKSTQPPGVESSSLVQKNPLATAGAVILLLILCSIQGLIVAAAVKLSLLANPDAWWPLWYLFGFGAALPFAINSRRDSDEGENSAS